MSQEKVDLFVIGAGSGGVRAARIAAGHGAKVAVAESFRLHILSTRSRGRSSALARLYITKSATC